MQIIIHRGTHQIGGIAVALRTASTTIMIDMGSELSMEENYVPVPLSVSGVTDSDGKCDAVFFTHYHGAHIGEMIHIREDIPLYMGTLAQEILLAVTKDTDAMLKKRIMQVNTFTAGRPLVIGDMVITPYSVDHSACDSYMFLIEADGKRILHTGDFRMHGFRGQALPKMLDKLIGKVDVLITEGTMLSRDDDEPMTERALQQRARLYLKQYKYVFVYAATTNLERICALSKAVPRGKYFLCDTYQAKLLSLIEKHWGRYSPLYRNIKRTTYDDERMARFRKRGGMMMVRDNPMFRRIISAVDRENSIILYSMWDGYRTRDGSTIPAFLNLAGRWAPLHTSGHASVRALRTVIEKTNPKCIIPIHTDRPDGLCLVCPNKKVAVVQDKEVVEI